MTPAVELLRELASSLHCERGEILPESRDKIVRNLQNDLESSRCVETLLGLRNLLQNGSDLLPAVTKIIDSVSWETLGLLLGCLEQSLPSESNRAGVPRPADGGSRQNSREVSTEAMLSERLVLEMAEIFSPKELHIIALEHLHAYSRERTVRTILTVLRRSTERMLPVQRAKFIEAALQPAIRATGHMAKGRMQAKIPQSAADVAHGKNKCLPRDRPRESNIASDDDKLDDEDSRRTESGDNIHVQEDRLQYPLIGEEGEQFPSEVACEAAAAAADAAFDFVAPLLKQSSAERTRALGGEEAMVVTVEEAGGERGHVLGAAIKAAAANAAPVNDATEVLAASDRSLAAYLGFALSALYAASETSAYAASSASASATPGDCSPATALARAEEQLVGLVMNNPVIDLRFVLLHSCRVSYATRVKRGRKGGGKRETEGHSAMRSARQGYASLGDLALTGAMPWTLRGVSCLAYLVACNPKLRDQWLPLVWSRDTERKLFLSHAKVLMRARLKRVACKGLELACFVADGLGRYPEETGAFAFDWHPVDEDEDGSGGDAWSPTDDECAVEDSEVLIDVMVSCPVPSLRSRGHSAMSVFLSAADAASRFRVLKRLIERCPWPNATGLLLDTFRREMDRAFRAFSSHAAFAGESSSLDKVTSPFASAQAGEFVREQVREACRRGPPASLLLDMDSRTGGLVLARYAHRLDRLGGSGGGAGQLELRRPDTLRETLLLVQGFLDDLRGASATSGIVGPEYFRLFILEDASQQCLQELQR